MKNIFLAIILNQLILNLQLCFFPNNYKEDQIWSLVNAYNLSTVINTECSNILLANFQK